MQDLSKLWKQVFHATYETLFEYGRIGLAETDGTYTVVVPHRIQRVYVSLGTSETTGIVEAINLHAPRRAGIPVKLLKMSKVYIIWGVDESSPAFTEDMYNVAYHHHGTGTGLEGPSNQIPTTFIDLDDTPSFYTGAAGKFVTVNNDEDALEYTDPALTTDDVPEGIVADRNYITDAEQIKLAGIEAGADATDAENVLAAGAVMTSGDQNVGGLKIFTALLTAQMGIAVTGASTMGTVTFAGGGINLFTDTDVAHGMTDILPTDVWAAIGQRSGTAGGYIWYGLSDNDTEAATLLGIIGTNTPTKAPIQLDGRKKSGTTWQALADAELLLNISNFNTLKVAIYGNGSLVTAGYLLHRGQKRVTTQFDKTNTTLATITGLSVNVDAGNSYNFRAVLWVTANATGGYKLAVAGTVTATAIRYQVSVRDAATGAPTSESMQTALAGAVGAAPGGTSYYVEIKGLITVNAAGTLLLQFAQNAATGTSSILVGSHFIVEQLV